MKLFNVFPYLVVGDHRINTRGITHAIRLSLLFFAAGLDFHPFLKTCNKLDKCAVVGQNSLFTNSRTVIESHDVHHLTMNYLWYANYNYIYCTAAYYN